MAQNVKTLNGLAIASVKTFRGLAIASVKTINGLDNTAASSYLLSENFEGTGYENSWTETGTGTQDEDYSTSGLSLEGSQCLRLAATAQTLITSSTFTAQSTAWAYFLFRFVSSTSTNVVFQFQNSSAVEVLRMRITTGGVLDVRAGGGTNQAVTDAMSTGTTYHVWVGYTVGSGSNAVASVGFSTDGTRPTSGTKFAQSTNGTATTNADRIRFGAVGSVTMEYIVDKIRVSDSTIGDNPT